MTTKKATAQSTEAGINIPPEKVELQGTTIAKLLNKDELYDDIENTDYTTKYDGIDNQIDGFLKKHYETKSATIDMLADVLNWDRMEVIERLKEAGCDLPTGW